MKSLLDILRDAEGYLGKHGSASPRVDAELLIAHALEMPRLNLYLQFDRPLVEAELAKIRPLLKRRASHEPLQYITGSTGFMTIEVLVGPGVLVPRPETERLVELALDRYDGSGPALDLCTGSGCIPLAIAAKYPEARITGVELSPEALAWAERNREALKAEHVDFRQGDLFAPVAGEQYALITANPPYVRDDEFGTLPPDVRDHEPRQALVSGNDGLDLVRRLVAEAPAHLLPGAWLLMEISPPQRDATVALLQAAGLTDAAVINDYSKRPRVAIARKPAE